VVFAALPHWSARGTVTVVFIEVHTV